MDNIVSRMVENLLGRASGPMHFRLVMQPLMAIIFAVRDGRRDARSGDPPYFWALFTQRGDRLKLLRSGWKSVGKIFSFALVLDAVYQFWVLRRFYPGEALIVAFFLAIVPYVVLRGPVNRLLPPAKKEGDG